MNAHLFYLFFSFIILQLSPIEAQVYSQLSRTKQLNLSAGLGYSSLHIDEFFIDKNRENGLGVSLHANYGIKEWIAPFMTFHYAPSINAAGELDNYALKNFVLGCRFVMAETTSVFRPWVSAGFGTHSSDQQTGLDDLGNKIIATIKASGIQLGVGMNYYINTDLALFMALDYELGTTDRVEQVNFGLLDEYSYNIFHINIGLTHNIGW